MVDKKPIEERRKFYQKEVTSPWAKALVTAVSAAIITISSLTLSNSNEHDQKLNNIRLMQQQMTELSGKLVVISEESKRRMGIIEHTVQTLSKLAFDINENRVTHKEYKLRNSMIDRVIQLNTDAHKDIYHLLRYKSERSYRDNEDN